MPGCSRFKRRRDNRIRRHSPKLFQAAAAISWRFVAEERGGGSGDRLKVGTAIRRWFWSRTKRKAQSMVEDDLDIGFCLARSVRSFGSPR